MKLFKTILEQIPLFSSIVYPLLFLMGLFGLDSLLNATYAMVQMLFLLVALGSFSKAVSVFLLILVLFLYLIPIVALSVRSKKHSSRLLIAVSLLFFLDAVWAGILLAIAGSHEAVFVLALDLLAFVGCLFYLKDKRS